MSVVDPGLLLVLPLLMAVAKERINSKKSSFLFVQSLEINSMPKLRHRGFIDLNGNTIGFRPQTQKLKLHTKLILPRESTTEEVSFEW